MQTLIIGGTGMLADLAYDLTIKSETVTIVAKTPASLRRFNSRLPEIERHKCSLVAADWNKQDEYLEILKQNITREGSPDLVIAWLHHSKLITKLIETAGSRNTIFIHVCGSRTPAMYEDIQVDHENIDYRQVILGYQVEPAGKRWLTDKEICAGVASAITNSHSLTFVGQRDA